MRDRRPLKGLAKGQGNAARSLSLEVDKSEFEKCLTHQRVVGFPMHLVFNEELGAALEADFAVDVKMIVRPGLLFVVN